MQKAACSKRPTLKTLASILAVAIGLVTSPTVARAQTTGTTNALPETLLPYLQNPTVGGMTVCFLAQGAQQVRFSWGADDASKLAKTAARGAVIPGTPWTIWKTRLAKLHAGTGYRYQVGYKLAGRAAETPVYHFRTLDPQAKTVRFAEFNDIHNHHETLTALMRWVNPEDYEFSVLLGDMWTNPNSGHGADKVFRSMETYIRLLNGSEKPMLFIRGNHETIGNFADKMAYLFDMPGLKPTAKFAEQNWFYTLRAGPVWFVALDGGDDFTKRYELFQPLRQRQAEWMRDLLAHNATAGASWRILLTHMPLYNDDWVTSEPCRQLWEPVLKDAGIDLEINGHQHCLWKQVDKGKTYEIEFKGHYPDQQDPQNRKHYSLTPLFPTIIGGGPSLKAEGAVKLVTADETTLHVRLLAATDGRLLTEFSAQKAK